MRQSFPLLIFVFMFFAGCFGQSNKAVEDQKKAFQALDMYTPKGVAPNANLFMRATINGKPWTATELIPDPDARTTEYRVTGLSGDERIGFNVYIPHIKEGTTIEFKTGHLADFTIGDELIFSNGSTGKFIVTKWDSEGFEGTFFFTTKPTHSGKIFDISNGVLRFPWANKS